MLMEPHWCDFGQCQGFAMPTGIASWLKEPASLTDRLIHYCDADFSVKLLSNIKRRPWPSEIRILGMRQGSVALTREVNLRCASTPIVFARTLIPVSSLRGRARRLAFLGERPLGHFLFADPTTCRLTMQFARLQPVHALYMLAMRGAQKQPDEIWARRTLYRFAQHPLLVNEVFLPALCDAD